MRKYWFFKLFLYFLNLNFLFLSRRPNSSLIAWRRRPCHCRRRSALSGHEREFYPLPVLIHQCHFSLVCHRPSPNFVAIARRLSMLSSPVLSRDHRCQSRPTSWQPCPGNHCFSLLSLRVGGSTTTALSAVDRRPRRRCQPSWCWVQPSCFTSARVIVARDHHSKFAATVACCFFRQPAHARRIETTRPAAISRR